MTHYLDSSAIIKLLVPEDESRALRNFLGDEPFATSEIARIEIVRAMRRRDLDGSKVTELSDGMYLLAYNTHIGRTASVIGDKHLGALDAIHIATAQNNELSTFITYDNRQAQSARELGLIVVQPGN
jgi:predicted nucleic acid-binding protein